MGTFQPFSTLRISRCFARRGVDIVNWWSNLRVTFWEITAFPSHQIIICKELPAFKTFEEKLASWGFDDSMIVCLLDQDFDGWDYSPKKLTCPLKI